jgi:molybdopterin molybdotransferase
MSRVFQPSSPQAVFAWTDAWPQLDGHEQLPLAAATGRVLAEDLIARHDIPATDCCASDGYALHASDTLGASDYSPLPVQLDCAGATINRGQATLVNNGDPLPAGADAVLPLDGGEASGAVLEIAGSLARGDGVIRRGEECRAGEILSALDRRLRCQDLARLALAGVDEVMVRRHPRVRIVLAGHFRRDADGPLLTALVNRDGGHTECVRVTQDKVALIDLLRQAGADLVLVAGGTGYAARDLAFQALEACGSVDLDGVGIHPGRGAVLGRLGSTPVVLLPGTPLACLCAYDLIAARVLRRWTGRRDVLPYRQRRLTLARKVVSSIGRLELARMAISGDTATPIATAEGNVLASAVKADGFLLVPEHSEGFATRSEVDIYLYDEYD